MSDRVPDPVPVGRFLAEEIEAHGWTQAEFAAVLGRPVQFVSEIVNGKKEVTRESAAQIGAALGQTPEFWLSFQDEYLLSEQAKSTRTQQELSEVRRRARLNRLVPVATLRKRGVLVGKDLDELEEEVAELLELDSIDDDPAFHIAARRSNHDEPVSSVQVAWVACVRRAARKRTGVKPFSKSKLERLAAQLPTLLSSPAGFRGLPERFADAGLVLVYVEALPGAKIDGCAFMLGKTPTIALSGRGKRLDKVLWTLLHEVAHVILGHVSSEVLVETLDDQDETDDTENEADRRAGAWLLPRPLPTPPARIGAGWVDSVASERRLAPIVIVGQLQQSQVLDWRTTLARNAPTVTGVLETW
ncbi:helix-turn-helix transcriptional regulator [Blastococcus saxobsidens]|uniref:Plasmid maintenance system antidote protein, XRE family n=1 Tax=Blastococcus saxobsidens (strain DD2) TaxID=1146883 RepID=H6RP68_BLASD|nr:helix-turn-helix domain-containing protein [Blastococcus saxobsidens]CCG02729.1 Plasmid maintenance system antidote protein, XRE family [Blastococcus saxobsidens DD2]